MDSRDPGQPPDGSPEGGLRRSSRRRGREGADGEEGDAAGGASHPHQGGGTTRLDGPPPAMYPGYPQYMRPQPLLLSPRPPYDASGLGAGPPIHQLQHPGRRQAGGDEGAASGGSSGDEGSGGSLESLAEAAVAAASALSPTPQQQQQQQPGGGVGGVRLQRFQSVPHPAAEGRPPVLLLHHPPPPGAPPPGAVAVGGRGRGGAGAAAAAAAASGGGAEGIDSSGSSMGISRLSPPDGNDPFLESLVDFESTYGAIWTDGWGNNLPSPAPFMPSGSPVGGASSGGEGAVSMCPASAAAGSMRALPPLPALNPQYQPLPMRREGSFETPVVPPLLVAPAGGAAGGGSGSGSGGGADAGVIAGASGNSSTSKQRGQATRASTAPQQQPRRSQRQQALQQRSQQQQQQQQERHQPRPSPPQQYHHHQQPQSQLLHRPQQQGQQGYVGQWRPLPGDQWANRETIQSLLAAIPDVPFIRPLPVGARASSELGAQQGRRPPMAMPPYGTILSRSSSAPVAGAALTLSSSASSSSLGGGSAVSWDGGAAVSVPRLERSYSSLSHSAAAAVIGQSHGVGLNFPYAHLDEMGRREYRRQAVFRWLAKRKRRKADRGVTYGERSTLALRRERVGGRFVKKSSNFVSVTELDRSRAVPVKEEEGGGGGASEEDEDEEEEEDEEESEEEEESEAEG